MSEQDGLDPMDWIVDDVEPGEPVPTGPIPTSVYRLFNEAGELLYVGITAGRYRRINQHAASKEWWEEVATATFQHLPDRESAMRVEARAIADENPRYNISRPNPDPPPRPDPVPPTHRRVKGVRLPDAETMRGTWLEPEERMELLDRQTKRLFKMRGPDFVKAWEAGEIDHADPRLAEVINLLALVQVPV